MALSGDGVCRGTVTGMGSHEEEFRRAKLV